MKRVCLLLILISVFFIIFFLVLDTNISFEPECLLPILNTFFIGGLLILASVFNAKIYIEANISCALFMCCGMLVFGSGSAIAGWFRFLPGGSNYTVTMHNIAALAGGLFLFLGALWEDRGYTAPKQQRKTSLFAGILGSLALVALLVLATQKEKLPAFVDQNGFSMLRNIVLLLAIILFFGTSILFYKIYKRKKSDYLYLYFTTLSLITLGLLAVRIQHSLGSPVSWVGRIDQYLAGVFAVLSIRAAVKSAKKEGASLPSLMKNFFINAGEIYTKLMEESPHAVISVNRHFRIFLANPATARIFGYQMNELIGLSFLELIGKDHGSLFRRNLKSDLKAIPCKTIEAEAVKKSGEIFLAEVTPCIYQLSDHFICTYIIQDISERKRSLEVERIKKKLEEAQRLAHIGNWEWDADTDETYWSGEMYRLLGLEPDAASARINLYFEHMFPADRERVRIALNRAIQANGRFDEEFRVLSMDGTLKTIHARAYTQPGPGGKVLLTGTMQDVSGRKLLEETQRRNFLLDKEAEFLREKEKEYLLILDGSTEASWIYDYKNGTLSYSDEWLIRLGASNIHPKEMNSYMRSLVHPDDLERIRKQRLDYAQNKVQKFKREYRIRTADGGYIWVLDQGKIIYGENGEPVKIYGTSMDITDRQKGQEELMQLKNELAAEVKSLNMLYELNSNFIIQNNLDKIIRDILKAAVSITNSDKGHIQMIDEKGEYLTIILSQGLGDAFVKKFKTLDLFTGTCGKAFQEKQLVFQKVAEFPLFTNETLRSMQDENIVYELSMPLVTSSGRFVGVINTFYCSEKTLNDHECHMLEMLARIAADKIDQQRIRETLQKSQEHALALVEELKIADRNKNEFINKLSHELRNPLAVIVAGLSFLDRSEGSPKSETAKEIIRRQIGQLCHLVDDLLDLTRITNNKVTLKKKRIELNKLILETAEEHSTLFAAKNMNLETILFGKDIYINADPVRIKQIIGNLLQNAIKFSNAHTITTVRTYEIKAEAVIRVRDNGIGFEPDFLSQLFEPFKQAENATERTEGGLGLGLAVVKGIVEMHGGSVSAESKGLGKGSEFIIRLPAESSLAANIETKAGF